MIKPSAGSFLCSKHFTPDQLNEWITRFSVGESTKLRSLKKGAVPSIFELPVYDGDGQLQNPTHSSPKKAVVKKKNESLKTKLKQSKKTVRNLARKLKRSEKKVAKCRTVIEALRKKTQLSESSVDVLEACCHGTKELLIKQRNKLKGNMEIG